MNNRNIDRVIEILKREIKRWQVPIVGEVANKTRDPYKVIISCLLSLRTKDETTSQAVERLFRLADNPEDIVKIPVKKIEEAIYPVGFYKVKARNIINISNDLIKRYNSIVPDDIDELLTFKGVGRKTANLVVTLAYNREGICVDTHVHRISNRLGYLKTENPDETERVLRKKLPKKYWIIYNDLLVTFGQNLCRPISPFCSTCKIFRYCDRAGVTKSR
ncbi:MAG: endonuclease III domain-containing protein [Nitrospirota bacterium]